MDMCRLMLQTIRSAVSKYKNWRHNHIKPYNSITIIHLCMSQGTRTFSDAAFQPFAWSENHGRWLFGPSMIMGMWYPTMSRSMHVGRLNGPWLCIFGTFAVQGSSLTLEPMVPWHLPAGNGQWPFFYCKTWVRKLYHQILSYSTHVPEAAGQKVYGYSRWSYWKLLL